MTNPPPQPPPSEPDGTLRKAFLWVGGGALGCMTGLLLLVTVPALIATASLGGAFAQVGQGIQALFAPQPPAASVVSSQTLVNQVESLGQLVVTSVQLAKADIVVTVQRGQFGSCNHTARHVATGTIEAGVDLSRITADSIAFDPETNTYTVTLPRPQLTTCYISSSDQYDRNGNLITCGYDWDGLRQIAAYQSLVEFRDDAVEGGILVTAERDARVAVTNFVSAVTQANVVVVYESVGVPMPASCNPDPPSRWQRDAATGNWVPR